MDLRSQRLVTHQLCAVSKQKLVTPRLPVTPNLVCVVPFNSALRSLTFVALIVVNIELLPLCSPNFKPGKPSDQAQTVGQMLNDLACVPNAFWRRPRKRS
jgi:hypothetical protein